MELAIGPALSALFLIVATLIVFGIAAITQGVDTTPLSDLDQRPWFSATD